MKKIILVIASCILILSSCSIQQRYYEKGFTISRYKPQHHASPPVNETSELKDEASLSASLENNTIPQTSEKLDLTEAEIFPKDSCDVLELKNNTTVRAKVVEVSPNTIRYKRCDNPNGPDYVANKADVSAIIYSNGEREEIRAPEKIITENPKPKKDAKPKRDMTALAWSFGSRALIPFVGLVFSLLGLVFGIIALISIIKHPSPDPDERKKNKLKTIATLVLSVIGLAVGILAILLIALLFTTLSMIY